MSKSALIVIDVQHGFDDPSWGARNNSEAEANISQVIAHCRSSSIEVIHVRHDSTNPNSPLAAGQPGNDFKDCAIPAVGELVISKNVNSAFIGTRLQAHLIEVGVASLIVVGLTTDHCVSTSVRMGANLGYQMTVIADATATFDRTDHLGRLYTADEIHNAALASLHGEFATVVSSLA
jgi:nicotinamidase-related amidase